MIRPDALTARRYADRARRVPSRINRCQFDRGPVTYTAWDNGSPKPGLYATEEAAAMALECDDADLEALRLRKIHGWSGRDADLLISTHDIEAMRAENASSEVLREGGEPEGPRQRSFSLGAEFQNRLTATDGR